MLRSMPVDVIAQQPEAILDRFWTRNRSAKISY
jgi:hypothetical protein